MIKFIRDKKLSALKQFLTHLLICTGLYLYLYFFIAADSLLVFKSICMIVLALAYGVLLIRYFLYYLYNLKCRRALKAEVDEVGEFSYQVLIDEDDVTIFSGDKTYIYPWTGFTRFGVHEDTLYILNEVNEFDSLRWHQNEMDSEAFSTLLEVLQQKQIKRMF